MKYKIVSNSSSYKLSELVQGHIERGWKPQGGVAYSMSMAFEGYAQAMIKED